MFSALYARRADEAKAAMFGFRFMATVFDRAQGRDVNYMEDAEDAIPKATMSLDATEGFFKALSEGARRHGAK